MKDSGTKVALTDKQFRIFYVVEQELQGSTLLRWTNNKVNNLIIKKLLLLILNIIIIYINE